jgi:hypothetical protein
MKILLGDMNTKVRREHIFKAIRNEGVFMKLVKIIELE